MLNRIPARVGPLALWLSLLLFSGSSHAQLASDSIRPDEKRLAIPTGTQTPSYLGLPGSLRLSYATVGPLRFGTVEGSTRDESELRGDARIRLQPFWVWFPKGAIGLFKLALDADLRWGPFTTDDYLGVGYDPLGERRPTDLGIRLTQAYLMTGGQHFGVIAGLVRPDFGIGLVANAGRDAPIHGVRQSPYGISDANDRNIRFATAVLPMGSVDVGGQKIPKIAISFGWDQVLFDDRSDWEDGDRTWQAFAGVSGYALGLIGTVGLVYRHQEHNEGGETNVTIAALSLKGDWALTSALRAFADLEYLMYTGESTYSLSVFSDDPLSIQAGGGVGRFGVSHKWGEIALEGGLASGDRDPYDRNAHTLSFDQNYQVGILMFSHQARLASAAGVTHISDPNYRGMAPRGADALATGGAIQNARFINPRVSWRALESLSFNIGYLYARSDVPFSEAYQTNLRGGDPTGPLGGPAGNALGHEWNAGLGWQPKFGHGYLFVRGQVALYKPGNAYTRANGTRVGDIIGGLLQGEYQW